MGHGYAYLISSRLWYDHPKNRFHFINRGVSGNKITDMAARWQTDTLDIKPDVLSILIGVNDVLSVLGNTDDKVDGKKFEDTYRTLLHQTKETLPDVQLILCEPFILPVGQTKNNWQQWTDEIQKRQVSVRTLAKEFDAIFVPLQDTFDKAVNRAPADYWIWDGIHPMPAGHELITRHWISVVEKTIHYIG